MPARAASEIVVVAHPPERRRQRAGAPAQAGQCCCCCCCCLHTVGGIIGAAVGPTLGAGPIRQGPHSQEADDYADDFFDVREGPRWPVRHGMSAVALFWFSTLALALAGTGIAMVLALADDGSQIVVWAFLLVLGLPLLQLIAAVPPAFYFLVSKRPDRWYELGQLGKVVAGLVVGTVLGIVVMVGIGLVLRFL